MAYALFAFNKGYVYYKIKEIKLNKMIRKLARFLRDSKALFFLRCKLVYAFMMDYKFYVNVSYMTCRKGQDALVTKCMLIIHQIEKGMSMQKKPRIFGGDKAISLINNLTIYKQKYGIDHYYTLGVNVLYEYLKNEWSDKTKYRQIKEFVDSNQKLIAPGYAGVKYVKRPAVFNEKDIRDFFFSRASIRDFSENPVSLDIINKAIEFAECTPSACNRQAGRVYYYSDKKIINQLIDNQLGPQGWCDNASGLIVVTENMTFFGNVYERHQAFIDGGLYAMNLVYGLHLQNIATCFKMFVREPDREMKFKEMAAVPYNETPIVLILIGHYKNESVIEPKSVRFTYKV